MQKKRPKTTFGAWPKVWLVEMEDEDMVLRVDKRELRLVEKVLFSVYLVLLQLALIGLKVRVPITVSWQIKRRKRRELKALTWRRRRLPILFTVDESKREISV